MLSAYRGTRELTINLVLRELRSRYKRSVLGWTWSLLNPLATVAIYFLVFSVFLEIKPPVGDPSGTRSFVLFLLCALLPFRFLAESMLASVETLVGNANLIRKVYFPRELLVVASVGALLVTFLIELGVVLVVFLISGSMVLPWIPMILVLVALETCIVLGISLILAPLNVYLRDTKHFVQIATQILFYAIPIVYPLKLVPEHPHVLGLEIPLRTIYELNPLVSVVECFRSVLYDLSFPPLDRLGYVTLWAVGTLALGHWLFGRMDRRLAEEV